MKEEGDDVVACIRGWEVVIIYNIHEDDKSLPEGIKSWENNGIFICDPKNNIKKSQIITIVEYLYEEGFINDRRTPYEILSNI